MTCNCAGTAPGYPQHEAYCGQEPDEDSPLAWWERDADGIESIHVQPAPTWAAMFDEQQGDPLKTLLAERDARLRADDERRNPPPPVDEEAERRKAERAAYAALWNAYLGRESA